MISGHTVNRERCNTNRKLNKPIRSIVQCPTIVPLLVFQKESTIPGAGEGVFLRRDAPAFRVVSLYSGFLYDYPIEANIYTLSKVGT